MLAVENAIPMRALSSSLSLFLSHVREQIRWKQIYLELHFTFIRERE